jgi:RNA polymerase sigma-70 factor (ECF subfamily)
MAPNRPTARQSISPVSDDELVRRFQKSGDHGAFRALAERHLPSIRRLLLVVLGGDPEEVQDAEQEVLLAMYRRLGSFRFQSSLRTFLYSLARNRAVDHLRRQRRHARTKERARALGVTGGSAHGGSAPGWVDAARPGGPSGSRGPLDYGDPLGQVLMRERTDALWRAFASLPDGQRQLLLMKEVEGFSVDEIAAVMSLPEGTVKSRLHRGRARLARILGGEE